MAVVEPMTPLGEEDARILALERGPIRGHTLKILLLDEAPSGPRLEDLRAEVAGRLPATGRWVQRLVPAADATTGLAWQDDPDFRIERHVRLGHDDANVSEPLDETAFRRTVADIMKAPLDREHPLWTLDLLPRLSDGRWALVWKVHHCLADGMAVMRAGAQMLWDGSGQGSSAVGSGRRTTVGAPAQAAAGARLLRLAGYRGLVLREFRRVHELSPLAGEVGWGRDVAFARCTLAELHDIRRAVGPDVTVNDVLLALVAGALREWLRARHLGSTGLKVQVPVSMQPDPAGATSGNRDSFLFVGLPLGESDPVARVTAVTAATRLRKNRHDASAIYALRRSLSHAPLPVRRALQHVVQGPHEYSLNISNVPGPRGAISVLGHHVDALYSVAEVAPRHGLRVAAVSLEGSLYVGLCADPDVVPDLDQLAGGIRAALDELHGRLGTAPTS